MLVSYTHYQDAQRAVDHLSDEGFPVEHTAIIWNRLRRVEHVTGRRNTATAARDGALSGAFLGSVLGLLLTLFVELDDGASALGVVLTYALVAAAAGAVLVATQHLLMRGQRDFTSTGQLEAETYEVWVTNEKRAEAERLLGVGTRRPTDPS